MELAYLLNPAFQYENRNGKPLTGGILKVFEHGTTIPYITWKNFDGDRNPAEIPLNDLGMAVVLVEADKAYDVFLFDINRVEQWSRVNVGTYGGAGGASGDSGDGFGAIRCTGVSRLTTDGNFQYSVQEVNGDSLDVLSGVLRADTGWYHYDATVRLIWASAPANREAQVKLAAYLNDDLASDVTSFDIGYSHDETVRISGEVKVTADDTVFNINVTGMPAGMEAQLVDFGMHTINSQGGSAGGSGGVSDVLQNGSSVVDNGVARVTVPTKTSELTNDSGFVTANDIRQVPASTSTDEGKVLTVDSNGDSQWEPAGGSSTQEIFLATYGTTTFDEILAAHNNGKAVFLYTDANDYKTGRMIPLESCFRSNYPDQSRVTFVLPFNNYGSYQANSRIQQNTIYVVNGNNVWSTVYASAIARPEAADVGKIYTATAAGQAMWENQRTPGNMLSVTNNQIDVTTTAGITDIQMVAALPANPVATVLYLIPET